MLKQASITSFTQPKPETLKRKRDTKKSTLQDTVSPSQISPDSKKVQVKVSYEKKDREQTMTKEQQEEVKSKTRGRVKSKTKGKVILPEEESPVQVPLPPSPETTKEVNSEEQKENCYNDQNGLMGKKVGEIKDPTPEEKRSEEEQNPQEVPTPMEVDEVGTSSNKESKEKGKDKVPTEVQKSKTEEQETVKDGQDTQAVQDTSKKSTPMQQLTFKAALTKQNTPILPQYKSHRVNVSFVIRTPKNKAKRTEYLAKGLNKFLTAAKKVAPSNRTVFVRRFKDYVQVQDT